MQSVAHVGQRDVDHRDVEDDHELREQDDEQERAGGGRATRLDAGSKGSC